MTRVTHRMMTDSALHNLQANRARVQQLNQQLTSGKTITKPSDDPSGTVSALQVRSDLRAQEQYTRNAEDGRAWLTTSESALTSGLALLHRARGLTLQGMNTGAMSVEAREGLAVEVRALREEMLGVANATHLGRPVFGGTTAGSEAFDPATGAYVGDSGTVVRRLDATTTVRVDSRGVDVFGGTAAVGATPAEPAGSVFAVLASIAQNLSGTGDPTLLAADLTALDTAFRRMTGAVADIGARYARTERMLQTAKDQALSMTGQLSQIEDVDLPRTILELQTQQVAYQASLGATAKVIQPTLMDFLR